MRRKAVVFLTGSRADFGKLKPLVHAVDSSSDFSCHLVVTGMHLLKRFGYTMSEISRQGFRNVYRVPNPSAAGSPHQLFASTLKGLSSVLTRVRPQLLIIHGDRPEALAGAVAGSLHNILTAHIEGGELSGARDGIIRHAVSKLAQIHLVANDPAKERLIRMGERPESVFVMGSPDIDVMLFHDLPSFARASRKYDLRFSDYGIVVFHPVSTERRSLARDAKALVSALVGSGKPYLVIFPNSDEGSDLILKEYDSLRGNPNFQVIPSVAFEYFLTFLRHSRLIIGNSSAGIREAPVYGIPSINVGSRQDGRFHTDSIVNVHPRSSRLPMAIARAWETGRFRPCYHFGRGDSAERFLKILRRGDIWQTSLQKSFYEAPHVRRLRSYDRIRRSRRFSVPAEVLLHV